jgi:hypothetical protein
LAQNTSESNPFVNRYLAMCVLLVALVRTLLLVDCRILTTYMLLLTFAQYPYIVSQPVFALSRLFDWYWEHKKPKMDSQMRGKRFALLFPFGKQSLNLLQGQIDHMAGGNGTNLPPLTTRALPGASCP